MNGSLLRVEALKGAVQCSGKDRRSVRNVFFFMISRIRNDIDAAVKKKNILKSSKDEAGALVFAEKEGVVARPEAGTRLRPLRRWAHETVCRHLHGRERPHAERAPIPANRRSLMRCFAAGKSFYSQRNQSFQEPC